MRCSSDASLPPLEVRAASSSTRPRALHASCYNAARDGGGRSACPLAGSSAGFVARRRRPSRRPARSAVGQARIPRALEQLPRQDAFTAILSARDGSATDTETFDHKGQEEAELFARFVTPESIALDIGCGVGVSSATWHLAASASTRSTCRTRCSPARASGAPGEEPPFRRRKRGRGRLLPARHVRLHLLVPGASAPRVRGCLSGPLLDRPMLQARCARLRPVSAASLELLHRVLLAAGGQPRPPGVSGSRHTLELAEFVCRQAGLEIEHMAVGLDGLVSEHEIGIVAHRPAAG